MLLGLDLGTQTIGTAFCDAGWSFASAGKTLPRGKFARDLAALEALVAERGVKGVVIGLPLNMDGSGGPRAQASRAYRPQSRAARPAGAAVGRALVDRERRAGDDRPGHEPRQARRAHRQPRRGGDPAGGDRPAVAGSFLMPGRCRRRGRCRSLEAVGEVVLTEPSEAGPLAALRLLVFRALVVGLLAFGAYLALS